MILALHQGIMGAIMEEGMAITEGPVMAMGLNRDILMKNEARNAERGWPENCLPGAKEFSGKITGIEMTETGLIVTELIIEPGRSEKNYWRDIWNYRELFYILSWR